MRNCNTCSHFDVCGLYDALWKAIKIILKYGVVDAKFSNELSRVLGENCRTFEDEKDNLFCNEGRLVYDHKPENKEDNQMLSLKKLIEMIPFVYDLTKEKFPTNNSQLSLELNLENDEMNIILYVRQYQYQTDIMEVIDEIRSEYGRLLVKEKGYILVTTDFQQPKEKSNTKV